MIGKHNTRLVGIRRYSPLMDRLSAVPAVLYAAVQRGRRDPVRSWYAAAGVLAVIFVVVTSIGVISGRSVHNGYPIMVQPPGPAMPTAGGAALTVPDGSRADARTPGGDGQTGTGPRAGAPAKSSAPTRSPAVLTPQRGRPSPTDGSPSTRPPETSPPGHSTPAGSVTARYIVYSSWPDGFTTGIELANHTGTTQTWKLKLVHERADGVRVKELWNATLQQGGATTNVFVGGALAPGATLNFGFNASKTSRNAVHPTSCTINNRACSFG